jgi:hypothetical protein
MQPHRDFFLRLPLPDEKSHRQCIPAENSGF